MPTNVRLIRIPSRVTQPLQPRPKFIKLRIATTLLGPVSQSPEALDVRRLAAEPYVQEDHRPHPVRPPGLGTLENRGPGGALAKPVEHLDRPRRDVIVGDRVDQPGASHQDALRKEFTDAWQCSQLSQGVHLGYDRSRSRSSTPSRAAPATWCSRSIFAG